MIVTRFYKVLYSETRQHSFFTTRVFCRLVDADLTIQLRKRLFLTSRIDYFTVQVRPFGSSKQSWWPEFWLVNSQA